VIFSELPASKQHILRMDPHEAYFRSLAPEEMQLLVLREVLYDGEWDEMIRDLEARKEGKPFVFQLKTRIEEDLERISVLRSYEEEHGVNLGKYVAQVHQAGGSQAK
jgi:hypothetical protein